MSLLPILPTMPTTIFFSFSNEYRCLNNIILVGYMTCKSQSFKKIQLHLMVDIHFAKNKFKSSTIGDLKRSPTVAFVVVPSNFRGIQLHHSICFKEDCNHYISHLTLLSCISQMRLLYSTQILINFKRYWVRLFIL